MAIFPADAVTVEGETRSFSPIGRLVVSTNYDEMPVDFFECWTTALWALDAVVVLVPTSRGRVTSGGACRSCERRSS